MKLLSTIAAVLISISAYSQDLIEYDNGIFTQNEEELSMEQIYDLTVLHKAGKSNVRRGINFDEMHKNPHLRGGNNALNFIGGSATGLSGGFSLAVGVWYVIWFEEVNLEALGYAAPGAGLCVVSYKAFSRIALSKKACHRKRDKEFYKVADKLNEAIKASNQ